MSTQAVITADIVNSTQLNAANEKQLMKLLRQVLKPNQFEFYRGDSFQVLIKQADEALRVALLCRTAAISLTQHDDGIVSDVKVSIGIGEVALKTEKLTEAKGEAFILSGRSFDEMIKAGKRLAIATNNKLAHEGLQVIADYLNAIFSGMTSKQAAVIFELLTGQTQQVVAEKLSRSKSTINQHVNAGRWGEIEKILGQYKNIINQMLL
jgi:hypothetical protein